MKEQCSNCRFWFSGRGAKWGLCRRYPPQLSGSGQTGLASLGGRIPGVDADFWCGEFRPAVVSPHSQNQLPGPAGRTSPEQQVDEGAPLLTRRMIQERLIEAARSARRI